MSQPDEDGFNEAPPPAPCDRYNLDEMREWSPERLRAFLAPYSHLDRPAETAGGSPRLTDETPGPAPCDWCGEATGLYAGSNVCRLCYEDFGGPTESR